LPRYFIKLAFDGAGYHGWQIQKNAHSVQAEINKSLSVCIQQKIETTGCGRTDTGVHARDFYAHFDTEKVIDSNLIRYKLNTMLPATITIRDVFKVENDVHARFDAVSRTYEYKITKIKDPFRVGRAYYKYSDLDINKMNIAAQKLLKYSDFSCFSKSRTQVKTNNCSIYQAEWKQKKNGLIVFTITANRFLRNMVRAIVGTLIEVGEGLITIEEFEKIIISGKRSNAGLSVPACGLYLTAVKYKPEYLINELDDE
jgi:tRNA pseudouridine38-40 synthase